MRHVRRRCCAQVSVNPSEMFDEMTSYIRLREVIGQIEGRDGLLSDAQVEEIAATLWDIALDLEDGELKEALARLQRAQERLSQAMRDGRHARRDRRVDAGIARGDSRLHATTRRTAGLPR